MDRQLPEVFATWSLGPLRLRNRIIKAATNEGMAPAGVPSQALVEHHRRIAAGGAAMTTVAYCAVSPDGRTFDDQLVLDGPTTARLRALTEAVHAEGAAACAQITHGGAFNFLSRLSTRSPLSASGGLNPPGLLCGRWFKQAMDAQDLERVREQFATAACQAEAAGFDAVEIHMGHGYLLSQFLSPRYNRRRDAYGGSPEARLRYPLDILQAVREAVGARLAVTCKISMLEGDGRGGGVDDAVLTARALGAAGADLIVLSAGMNVEAPWAIFGSALPPGGASPRPGLLMRLANLALQWRQPRLAFRELYLLDAAARVRAAVSTPLAYIGGAKSRAGVERLMQQGFDAVVMGRALLHDAGFVNALAAGQVEQSGCTACNACVASMYTPAGTHCPLTATPDPALNRQPAAPPTVG